MSGISESFAARNFGATWATTRTSTRTSTRASTWASAWASAWASGAALPARTHATATLQPNGHSKRSHSDLPHDEIFRGSRTGDLFTSCERDNHLWRQRICVKPFVDVHLLLAVPELDHE